MMVKSSPLLERIRAAKAKRQAKKDKQKQKPTTSGAAMAIFGASALISCILVGLAIGAGIDALLGSKPWGMLIMSVFGVMAGLLTVIRQANRMQAEQAASMRASADKSSTSED